MFSNHEIFKKAVDIFRLPVLLVGSLKAVSKLKKNF